MYCILWFADTISGTMALGVEDNYCRIRNNAVTLQHDCSQDMDNEYLGITGENLCFSWRNEINNVSLPQKYKNT